ncbi:hypothetical protein LOC51_09025 [Rubrivivax sp. JA1024]|nr:hypothetical protein [Rubrivivax sp. JA1024]
MRTTRSWTTAVFAGALIASSLSAAPALARGQQDQRNTSETASSSGCTSYERAPDGSWRPIPCISAGAASMPARRSPQSAEASN